MRVWVIDEDDAIIVMRVLLNNGFKVNAQKISCDGLEETLIEFDKEEL